MFSFAFRHLPVLGNEDTTANFEQLQPFLSAIPEEALSAEIQALLAKIVPGAWTELTLGPKIEAVGAFQTPRVRKEQGGAVARLRGGVAPKTGEELKAGETVATLPAGFRPPTNALMVAFGSVPTSMTISGAGVITIGANVAAKVNIGLDGLTFNLT